MVQHAQTVNNWQVFRCFEKSVKSATENECLFNLYVDSMVSI